MEKRREIYINVLEDMAKQKSKIQEKATAATTKRAKKHREHVPNRECFESAQYALLIFIHLQLAYTHTQ